MPYWYNIITYVQHIVERMFLDENAAELCAGTEEKNASHRGIFRESSVLRVDIMSTSDSYNPTRSAL